MQQAIPSGTALQSAITMVKTGAAGCVLVKQDAVVHAAEGRGVKPLLALYESEDGRGLLGGALLADKVIGRAAAMLAHLGAAQYVYGAVMSEAAQRYLESVGISHSYGKLVPLIQNRSGNGVCPIESSVLDINDAEEGYKAIRATVDTLMQATVK